jgi:phosphogluconate dehydratase
MTNARTDAEKPAIHPVIAEVTARVTERSDRTRSAYLERTAAAEAEGPVRRGLACSNLAHGFAAFEGADREALRAMRKPGVAIVSAYNDMLSAHRPLKEYPDWLKVSVREAGGVAQFAGGVPAMCDGITQGRTGMELSLFSREVIAMATAVALSHDMFDGALLLGVCDKIVPGLLIGALSFGHLPAILVPAGPMSSGLPNSEKARIRQLYAEGRATREQLLDAESASYHSPGTCTFYGTANSNQMVVEVMGLHLPGASFVQPGTPLRRALTEQTGRRVVELSRGREYTPIAKVIDEKAVVNGVVSLLATGGSTNHTLHLVAIAAAAGIQLTWDDFSDLSAEVPLLAKVYPNGSADINHFHAAGGIQFLVGTLLDAGMLHEDVNTVAGPGLHRYRQEPILDDETLVWRDVPTRSLDEEVLRPADRPFAPDGGLRMVSGNLGRAVIKVSAVAPEHRVVQAPARVFTTQAGFNAAFSAGELKHDVVIVIRNQGPQANGMPELHGLTPALGVLMDRGHEVALLTDGRMSGASGKIPAAIQVTPEAAAGGPLARIADGDIVRLDANAGTLDVLIDDSELELRELVDGPPDEASWTGTGRELFGALRRSVGPADRGASVFGPLTPEHFGTPTHVSAVPSSSAVSSSSVEAWK